MRKRNNILSVMEGAAIHGERTESKIRFHLESL